MLLFFVFFSFDIPEKIKKMTLKTIHLLIKPTIQRKAKNQATTSGKDASLGYIIKSRSSLASKFKS